MVRNTDDDVVLVGVMQGNGFAGPEIKDDLSIRPQVRLGGGVHQSYNQRQLSLTCSEVEA